MNSGKTWRIYDCDFVDMAKLYPEAAGLPKAIAIHGEGPYREAEGLPKGFVTKVLLDYDFSDDGQVLAFVREYGPVVCPYGGTMFRTAMAIGDPRYYPDMLRRASFMRGGKREGTDACIEDADYVCRSGFLAMPESEYLLSEGRGFARYLLEDDRLVATERLRAIAWEGAAGATRAEEGRPSPPCYVSVEETRGVLYLLQAASVVLQGYSYLDASQGGRGEVAAEDAAAAKRRAERLFGMFVMGRANVIRALSSIVPSCLVEQGEGDEGASDDDPLCALDEAERQRATRILAAARQDDACDPGALRLLGLRPAWQAWGRLRSDLAVFVEACLTNGWMAYDGQTPLTGDLMVDVLNGMTLQRAIARQILHQLDVARLRQDPARRANASNEPAWHVCNECGRLFMFRSTTNRLVLKGEGKPNRNRIPTSDTCSEMCRLRKSRANHHENDD